MASKPISLAGALVRLRRIEAKLDRAIAFGQPAAPLPVQTRNVAGQFTTSATFGRTAARRAYGAPASNPQREFLKRALLAAIRRK